MTKKGRRIKSNSDTVATVAAWASGEVKLISAECISFLTGFGVNCRAFSSRSCIVSHYLSARPPIYLGVKGAQEVKKRASARPQLTRASDSGRFAGGRAASNEGARRAAF